MGFTFHGSNFDSSSIQCLTLNLLALALLLVGCLETEKLEVPPAANCETVESTLNQAIYFKRGDLAAGDFVHKQETLAPLANNPQLVADVVEKLIAVQLRDDGLYETRSLETVIRHSNGQSQQQTKEGVGVAPTMFNLCPMAGGVSFHGLQHYQRKVKVTEFKDSCGNYPNCEISISEIRVDLLYRSPEGRQEVRKFNFILSKDVPYLARNLKECMTGTVAVNGQPIAVTQCKIVRNFGNIPVAMGL